MMEPSCKYEYDETYEILVRCSFPPKLIRKDHLVWEDLEPKYDSYARAIFMGQGCWERLDTITEAQALKILDEWGYTADSQTENAN